MGADNTIYLTLFVLMSIFAVLMPFVWILRYRYYIRQFDGTVYQMRFRVGWPIQAVGGEMAIIGGLMIYVWLQQWLLTRQDQWLIPAAVISSLGFLCSLVGLTINADGFEYLRTRSRRRGAPIDR